jgi:hypothetical protein
VQPDDALVWEQIAQLHLELDEVFMAILAAERACSLRPSSWEVIILSSCLLLRSVIICHSALCVCVCVDTHLQLLLALFSSSHTHTHSLSRTLISLSNSISLELSRTLSNSQCHLTLARARYNLGELSMSEVEYARAIELCPELSKAENVRSELASLKQALTAVSASSPLSHSGAHSDSHMYVREGVRLVLEAKTTK